MVHQSDLSQLLARRLETSPPARPLDPTSLLLHPISADPTSVDAVNDPRWVSEHAGKRRFYVAGFSWFVDVTSFVTDIISRYRYDAVSLAAQCKWFMPESWPSKDRVVMRHHWGSISRQQFYEVTQNRPVTFAKAALFILSCELAFQEFINRNDRLMINGTRPSATEIYRHLFIVPACWNVNDFNVSYLNTATENNPNFLYSLVKETDQHSTSLFLDLAQGCTVTYSTALHVKAFCDKHGPRAVGPIRYKSGVHLGRRNAAPGEYLDV